MTEDAVVVTDLAGFILFVNDAASRLLNVGPISARIRKKHLPTFVIEGRLQIMEDLHRASWQAFGTAPRRVVLRAFNAGPITAWVSMLGDGDGRVEWRLSSPERNGRAQ